METVMKKGRGESALSKAQRLKAAGVLDIEILEVYDYWLLKMRPGRTRVPALDHKRRLKVARAIADYGIQECIRPSDGCAASDFHMGRNKANKRYDDLELIFRDQDHVECFLSYLDNEGPTW